MAPWSVRLARWGCGAIACLALGFLIFLWITIQNMWVAIYPGTVVNEFHRGMEIVHVSLGNGASHSDLYVPHRYIMYMDYSNIEKGEPSGFVLLRLSFRQMLALGDSEPVTFNPELANAVDKDDMVQLHLEPSRTGFVDWILAQRIAEQKLHPAPTAIDGFSVLKSNVSYQTTAYLLPNEDGAHSDIFLEQANGLSEIRPYSENLIVGEHIYARVLFGHSHLSQWRELDKAVRRIVARLAAPDN